MQHSEPSKLVVVDGNNISHAAFHTSQNMRDSRGRPTGMTVTFLSMLLSARKAFNFPCEFVVAWDGRNCWRKGLYSEYKANRKSEPDTDYQWSRESLEELLPSLGIHQVRANCQFKGDTYGLEADDIAALYIYTNQTRTLVSSDKDWLQLWDEDGDPVRIYRSVQKHLIETQEDFQEATGYSSVEEMRFCKALTGESGDNIPGIKGVGTVTARKFYHNEIAAEKPVYRTITSWLEDPLGYPRSYALWSLDLECIPKEPYYMGVNGTKNAEMAHNALDNIEASKLISQRIWDKLWS